MGDAGPQPGRPAQHVPARRKPRHRRPHRQPLCRCPGRPAARPPPRSPWANVRKRLARSPKIYVRDSGIVHSLLRIEDREALLRHPIAGASWEGMVVENLIAVADNRATPGFYRTAAGAEIDLVLDWAPGESWAIEVKRSRSAKPTRGFYSAIEDVQPSRSFVVYPGTERFALGERIEAISLAGLCDELIAQAR